MKFPRNQQRDIRVCLFVCLFGLNSIYVFLFFSFSLWYSYISLTLSISASMLTFSAYAWDCFQQRWQQKQLETCWRMLFNSILLTEICLHFSFAACAPFVYVLTFYFCVCLILSSLPSLSICMFLDMEEFLFIVTKKHVVRPHLAYSLERSFHSIHIHTIFDNDA